MSFWSGEKLIEQQDAQNLITSDVLAFSQSNIDCNAYRLHIGPECYVSPSEDSPEANAVTTRKLDPKSSFTIPPGQFAFFLTEETVKVPKNAMAFISMRTTLKFRGLVNVSGFNVDPGYDGRLIFSVFNAAPAPIHLKRGDDCLRIWYADLDRASTKTKTTAGFDEIPSSIINPVAGGVLSLEGLDKKITKFENAQTQMVTIMGVMVTILLAVFAHSFIESKNDQHTQSSPATIQLAAPSTQASQPSSGSTAVGTQGGATAGAGSINPVAPKAQLPLPSPNQSSPPSR